MRKLTTKQKQAILTHNGGRTYKALLRRFRAAAKNGQTRLKCPLCVAFQVACVCSDLCPLRTAGHACMEYIPKPPPNTYLSGGIETIFDYTSRPNALANTKAWAAKIVAILEGLQEEST